MKRLAVRWRLTIAFAAVMAAVLCATGLFVYQRQATSLDQTIDRSLRVRAVDIATLAQQSDTALRDARFGRGRAAQTELAELIDASGRVLDRTPGLPAVPVVSAAVIAAARRGAGVVVERRLAGVQPVRLLVESVPAQDQKLVVVVGQSLQERNLALSNLVGVLLVGGPIALLLASLAGYGLTGAALAPVEAMRRRAAGISATDLGQRLPSAGGNDELGRLARTLNEMLARVDAAMQRERALASDASHELRTPLAVLRTELELIGRERPVGAALQAGISSAIEETDRLSQLADDLLLLASADDQRLAINPSRLSAAELLQNAAERARRLPQAAVKQVTVQASDDEVSADPDRTAQALDNLTANAVRHARTHIHLHARREGALVELHVTDDGEGFPPEFLPRAWERFARADAGRSEEGAGLGLAIVRAIAEGHGGHAAVSNLPDGGADVWVALPASRETRDRPAARGAASSPPLAEPARRT